jgi:hypothetical protein
MTKEETEAAKEYVRFMLRQTLRLVEVGSLSVEPPEKHHSAAGVMIELRGRYFVLSAGHVLSKGKWVIETNKTFYPPKVVVLSLPAAHAFYNVTEDFAWTELDLPALFKKMKEDPKFDESWVELSCYKGPLDQLDPSMPFKFASWKATKFFAGINKLERELRYEIHMRFDGEHNGLYRFLLARKHQGDPYILQGVQRIAHLRRQMPHCGSRCTRPGGKRERTGRHLRYADRKIFGCNWAKMTG